MNMVFHELRRYGKGTLGWALALSTLAVIFLCMFPAFTRDIEASQKILSTIPQALREALDISLSTFFTVYGFFAYMFTFVSLAGAVQAMNLGVDIFSKEVRNKTADFLLSKPVSRARIVTGKLCAAGILLLVTNGVFSLISSTAAHAVSREHFSYATFLLISATLLGIQLFFMALGSLIAVWLPKIKSVISVSLPTVFGFFIVSTLGSILGNEHVRYITPFKFFESSYIITHHSYELQFVVLELVLVSLALFLTYRIYLSKDFRAAS